VTVEEADAIWQSYDDEETHEGGIQSVRAYLDKLLAPRVAQAVAAERERIFRLVRRAMGDS